MKDFKRYSTKNKSLLKIKIQNTKMIDNNYNTKTFIIFATFIRRFNDLHNKMNTINLQASVAAIRGNLDYQNEKY